MPAPALPVQPAGRRAAAPPPHVAKAVTTFLALLSAQATAAPTLGAVATAQPARPAPAATSAPVPAPTSPRKAGAAHAAGHLAPASGSLDLAALPTEPLPPSLKILQLDTFAGDAAQAGKAASVIAANAAAAQAYTPAPDLSPKAPARAIAPVAPPADEAGNTAARAGVGRQADSLATDVASRPAGATGPAPGDQAVPGWPPAAPQPGGPVVATTTAPSLLRSAGQAGPATQVSAAVAAVHLAPNSAGQVTIHLQPADLGAVQVRIERTHDGSATVTVQVERAETLHTLQQDISHLHQALDRAGVPTDQRQLTLHLAPPAPATTASADAGGSGRQGFQQQRPPPPRPPGGDAAPDTTDDTAAPRWLALGVDITA